MSDEGYKEENKSLRAEVDRYKADALMFKQRMEKAEDENDALRAEVERLKGREGVWQKKVRLAKTIAGEQGQKADNLRARVKELEGQLKELTPPHPPQE